MADDQDIIQGLLEMASEAEQGAIKSFECSSGAAVRLVEERAYLDHAIALLDLAERARKLAAMRAQIIEGAPRKFPGKDMSC